jgi:hypothetical protein
LPDIASVLTKIVHHVHEGLPLLESLPITYGTQGGDISDELAGYTTRFEFSFHL